MLRPTSTCACTVFGDSLCVTPALLGTRQSVTTGGVFPCRHDKITDIWFYHAFSTVFFWKIKIAACSKTMYMRMLLKILYQLEEVYWSYRLILNRVSCWMGGNQTDPVGNHLTSVGNWWPSGLKASTKCCFNINRIMPYVFFMVSRFTESY